MDPAHSSLMPQAVPTVFGSVLNMAQMIKLNGQRRERHTPDTHAGNAFIQTSFDFHIDFVKRLFVCM